VAHPLPQAVHARAEVDHGAAPPHDVAVFGREDAAAAGRDHPRLAGRDLGEDARLTPVERDAAVDDLIALVGAVDGILQAQANVDAGYFACHLDATLSAAHVQRVRDTILKAYRWQYIVSGVGEPRFQALLSALVTPAQMQRVQDALAPLTYAVPARTTLPMAA